MDYLSCCGTDCSTCGCYGGLCKGCNECKGEVFHAPEGKPCPIYDCVVNQRKMQNCAQCREMPCSTWRNTRDPKFTDEEFEKNIENRVKALKEMI
ncbi:MAG: DUF3795 domain-containing protein [Lachnospiraceae bacterium]|nr:DUF3795 domain-containing protein [Lachnospiraceae bacterium]MDE6625842.1 DUF3795 domain-containing protein [Lachnospiraceae bacterium]